jgi:hypothetical protein
MFTLLSPPTTRCETDAKFAVPVRSCDCRVVGEELNVVAFVRVQPAFFHDWVASHGGS